ncbi:MAG TPA: hypothetical protein VJ103_02705 [Candidatus Paceibacterota bacterium]|nr:hypothetical protein [Candidatus Paceibacterota bacterium]
MPEQKKSSGALIGTIIIILILIIGGIYFWKSSIKEAITGEVTEENIETAGAEELGNIDTDLNALLEGLEGLDTLEETPQ